MVSIQHIVAPLTGESMSMPSQQQFDAIRSGYDPDPSRSLSLRAEAYTEPIWFGIDQREIISKSWQWVCHAEKVREPGSFTTADVAGKPIVIIRDQEGVLRAFYNVCQHRAHPVWSGEGKVQRIVCPYHAWRYRLDGQLSGAPHTADLKDFSTSEIRLKPVQVEEFCGFIFVNLDSPAQSLRKISGALEAEIRHWAADVDQLTFGHRLTYDIKSNWKNVVDNFLECYHCPVAHKDFCTLVDMKTYKVTTHGVYSSHMADAGRSQNSAYDTSTAKVRTHAVWWLWPNTCLMRYPGRGSMIVLHIIPLGADRTLETYDFFLETPQPDELEKQAIHYLDTVLQKEDIALVENVQRGMETPAFTQGRIVNDPQGSGKSEHALHHFHGLVLGAYDRARRG
jgi:choline monooxygenase